MAIYKPYNVTIQTDVQGVTPVHLIDALNIGLQLGPEVLAEIVADNNAPKHVALVAAKLLANFATFAIKDALATIGVSGLSIEAVTQPGVTLMYRKYDDNGAPVAGANQRSMIFKGGVIVPKSLSCQHGQDARLMVDIVPVKYSTNAIVVLSDTATLPTLTIAATRWTLGPITVGGYVLTEYDSLEIDFGNTIESRATQSDVYPTHIEQRTFAPKITIRGINPLWFAVANIPIGGKAATVAGDKIYLRKRAQDDTTFVIDATAVHIKFTFGGLVVPDEGIRAEAQRATETSLVLTLAVDASGNAPLIVNTASAIT